MVYISTDADKALRDRDEFELQREYDTDKFRLFCESVRERFDKLVASERAAREERMRAKMSTNCEEFER